MRAIIVAAIALVTAGCASLSGEVFESVQRGDSSARVLELFGEPGEFRPSAKVPGAIVWRYQRRSNVCEFLIVKDTVADFGCETDPSYVHPAAAFFKGFGEGMQNQRQQQNVHCTSDYAGGYNCRSY